MYTVYISQIRVLILIADFTTFWMLCVSDFFRCLVLNLGVISEFQTNSLFESWKGCSCSHGSNKGLSSKFQYNQVWHKIPEEDRSIQQPKQWYQRSRWGHSLTTINSMHNINSSSHKNRIVICFFLNQVWKKILTLL